MRHYRFIEAPRDHYPLRLLCQLVEVPASGYYAWHRAQQQKVAQREHDHEALRSQSRRGDCYDSAQAESLRPRLKTEVLEVRERPVFADLADAKASVA